MRHLVAKLQRLRGSCREPLFIGGTMLLIGDRCTGCGRCVAACPQRVLSLETLGRRKRAQLKGGSSCDGCGRCLPACPIGCISCTPLATSGLCDGAYAASGSTLPWSPGSTPLMLAPMQGLTNRALRGLFADWVRPDVLFTEFVRAKNIGGKPLSAVDRLEIGAEDSGAPLVVQLIGPDREALVAAAVAAEEAGAKHLNLNLGCPYGRMQSGLTGGGMLRAPSNLATLLPALRAAIRGSFSVKIRAGYDDPAQIFALLPLIAEAGVDFLILHPRTVLQEYGGTADHHITARVVQATRLPVIANGDITSAEQGKRILAETGAAGLMLGRGAIADPLLFSRLRGAVAAEPSPGERGAMYRHYLGELIARYGELFCGEAQLLGKVKTILRYIDDPDLRKPLKRLQKAETLRAFIAELDGLNA